MKHFFVTLFLKITSTKAIFIPLLAGAVTASSIGVIAGVNYYNESKKQAVEEVAEVTEVKNTSHEIIIPETTSAPVELIPIEELNIIEDNSAEPVHDVEVTESSGISSTGVYEVNQLVYGIDVSKWQGYIDWSRVANSGVQFAIIKCGGNEGGFYEDAMFEQNIQGALANGIPVGVYFYSGATDSYTALQEASYVLSLISKYQITYPVVIDWEIYYGDYNSVTNALITFCDTIASYGYQPMVYSNRNSWYTYFDGAAIASRYKAWMACYFNDYYYTSKRWQYGDDLPSFNYNYDMWQYGITNTVDGINGWCDMNIAFFGYANYQVQGLQDARIELKESNPVRYLANDGTIDKSFDFYNNAKAINSIGYDNHSIMEYFLYDSSGREVDNGYDYSKAFKIPGKYKLVYKFKDPKSGVITKETTLTVVEVTETFTAPDITAVLDTNGFLPANLSLTNGVSCVTNVGESGTITDYCIIRTDASGTQTTIDKNSIPATAFNDGCSYKVRYTFNVPKDGVMTHDANLIIQ